MDSAWIQADGGLLLYACDSIDASSPWDSAVSRLIFGVTMEFGVERLRYLRKRIHTDYDISDWDRGLVKVCAKRVSKVASAPQFDRGNSKHIDIGMDLHPDASSRRLEDLIGTCVRHRKALSLACSLATQEREANAGRKAHLSPRPVGAILCDADGKILGSAVNTNANCQMRHAEVNLMLDLASRGISGIPTGATLFTSLKPCTMCASLILSLAQKNNAGPGLRVVSAEDDPGPMGRHHLLDECLTIETNQATVSII